jgi:F-type H+-transporting ATPase subunit delta
MNIAGRYATALFALTEAARASDTVAAELSTLASAVKEDAAFDAFLRNPLIGRDVKSHALQDIAQKGEALTKQSLITLAEQGRAELLPYVAEAFAAQVAQAKGELVAEVTSARALAPAIEKQIADALKKATGKTVRMELHQDPAVLGGVRIKLGSLLLDATLAGALDSMKTRLLNAS